jgi:hypothetical protein
VKLSLIWFLLKVVFTLCSGVVLETGQHGVHLVVEVNMLNPSSRIQPGDEIVQVNYQTVVGWQTKKVTELFHENLNSLANRSLH